MRFALLIAFAGTGAGGPDTMEVELIRALAALDQQNEYRVFCLPPNASQLIGVTQKNFSFQQLWPHVRALSMLSTLPLWLLKNRPHVFHAPTVPPPLTGTDYVMTLNCSTTFVHPELLPARSSWRLRMLVNRGIRKARMILCVSQNVRDLVMERFGVHPDQARVVYLGVNPAFHPVPQGDRKKVLESYAIDRPYFLFCARYEHRKNILGLVKAFNLFKKETRLPHKLVLTGSSTPAIEEFNRYVIDHRLQDEVMDLGKAPREDLPALYSGAEALVFPSLWEGFGMSIVEAMACGTPVVTSNISSLPEISGGAALLVNPHSPASIAAGMHRVCTDSTVREALTTRGLERAKAFSWRRTARETLTAYQEMASA